MGILEESYLEKINNLGTTIIKKRAGLWNCACMYCGDSKTNSRKKRGFFYYGIDKVELIYSCRNCGVSVHFSEYLAKWHNSYHTQYKLERMRSTPHKLVTRKPPEQRVDKRIQPTIIHNDIKAKKIYQSLADLPDNHIAKKYMIDRKLTKFNFFGYVDNFSRYVDELTGCLPKYEKLPKDKRIIIPITTPEGELVGFQGRALNDKSIRYITIKLNEEKFVKVYGLDRYNKNEYGFMLEGAFDSILLPNSLAMCGSSLDMNLLDTGYVDPDKLIIVYDNEPRNKEIVAKMRSVIDAGFRIHIPRNFESTSSKDINKMYMDGQKLIDIATNIVKNSYSGARAILQLNNWSR
jgi:hypothetical protein